MLYREYVRVIIMIYSFFMELFVHDYRWIVKEIIIIITVLKKVV